MSINRVAISGNLTRDAELRTTQSGMSILDFGVAVNDRRKNQQTGQWEDYPNFIDCTIEKGKEGYGVNFAGKLIPLPQGKFPDKLMAEYAGKTVVLGVRPEDFHTESAFLEMSEDSTVEAEVEIAEMMGAEIYIHAVCGGQKLIVRAPSRVQAESGDHISLAIDKNKIHLFDKETEQAINIK